MRTKRLLLASALLSAVALLAAACGREEGAGGQAAECTAEALQALGASRVDARDFKLAVQKTAGARHLGQAQRTVKIGVFGDLTGQNSQLVVHIRNSTILAVEKANEAGDLPVRLEVEQFDNKDGNPDTAPALAQRAIGDAAIVGIVGPAFSGETEAAMPLFNQAGLTAITASATRTDLTTKGWRVFFRGVGNDNSQGEIGRLVVDRMGCRRIAIVDDKSAYGAGLAAVVQQSVEQAGGEVVLREGIEATTDYTSLVDSLLAEDPDLVYYAGYSAQSSLVVKQYREKGGEAVFMSGDGSKDSTFESQGRPGNEDAIVTCPCGDAAQSDDPQLVEFAREYRERFDIEPGVYAGEGWDVAQIFIAAIKAGGADVSRSSVLDYVTNLEDFRGITKTFNWTDQHEIAEENLQIYAYRVQDGRFRLLGTIEELES